ncbi:hypothetical protein BLA39750_04919 [Burkholderia lata]|uniref:Peptidase S8/S53 domain-containing protein n=2 Tax=Burkholderia lata (strain ATCC 17760 / DSM 23089 / LMG 22485 / NCIMB 9086 / R18194 / 383) TaxID=482957 RepID=A0A6P2ZJA8_BURL3|nr:hypothetical protein BLA39750_04919 [Burkholderia lata]
MWLSRLGMTICAATISLSPLAHTVLGPSEHIDDLKADPTGIYAFIIRGDNKALVAAQQLKVEDTGIGPPVSLPLIDGVALALKAADATALAQQPGIVQVWYVPRPLFGTYVHVIQSFQYIETMAKPPEPVNLSLGPPGEVMPLNSHIEEPMNEATRRMSARGFIIVFAAGNYYNSIAPNPGVINPWCLPEWVICVGAARPDLKGLWSGSARGKSEDPSTWPDVVANGVDVLSAWPAATPKTLDQKEHDEASELFRKKIPKEKWNEFSLMSGTSQATAQVTRAVSQVAYFIQQAILAHPSAQLGQPLFSITIPQDRLAATGHKLRLTGDLGAKTADGVVITYRWVEPWRLIKQILIDTAIPMKDNSPGEVGAGFVSPEYIDRQFGQYGRAPVAILPVKALP